MRPARRQEGMRGSRDLRTPTTHAAHDRHAPTRPQASRRAPSHPCPPASTLTHAGCPPIRAYARTGGRCRSPAPAWSTWPKDNQRPHATVLPAERQRGWEDRRRAYSTAAGGHARLERPAHANNPRRARPARAHPAAGVAARLMPPMPSCQRADARWLSSHPRLRADGRTVPFSGSSVEQMAQGQPAPPRDRPPGRAPARLGGQTPCVQHGGRRACVARETCERRQPHAAHDRHAPTRPQASRRAPSHPCPPASTLTRAGCPPIRAYARTGGRCRSPAPAWSRWPKDKQRPHATVLPAERQRGWEDRRRAYSTAAGGHARLGRPADAADPALS